MKYSVLMSVHEKDNPTWLNDSISSMMIQTIKPDDFVLVSDGPLTEELESVIEKYVTQYQSLFQVIRLPEEIGLGPSLSIGITHCRQEWIARMDAENYAIRTRMERQLAVIENQEDVDIIGSNVAEFTCDLDLVESFHLYPTTYAAILKESHRRNPFAHSAVLFRKSKVLEAGSYRNCYLVEDYDLWIRMLECNAKAYNVPSVLVYVRKNEDFYKRRGSIAYLKSILEFKKEQYQKKYFSLSDYLWTSIANIFACILPNRMRKTMYKHVLKGGR